MGGTELPNCCGGNGLSDQATTWWDEQKEPYGVGDEPGSQKNRPREENQETVQQPIGRDASHTEFGLHLTQDPQPLDPCEKSTQRPSGDHQRDRGPESDQLSNLDQKKKLEQRNQSKEE